MYSQDYTKEIGLSTGEKIIPLAFAIPLIGVMSVGAGFGLVEVNAAARPEKAPETVSATVAQTGHAVATR